ncbi:hypothetical protein FisN_11Lh134 [Fistulifera solaris]|uniref:DUF3752 domain-containing protein n=1 Tax=Fistulifera solaris TaxID=1519565 RepID=A0A1Z5J7B3_FISSO|nr:hypothetical protein FisN_11Lh134 [Fistulifera solaris]|eukprot:GAX09885.1 hypothetical protein FisN_11Lh134 [Fistulifera solaris]
MESSDSSSSADRKKRRKEKKSSKSRKREERQPRKRRRSDYDDDATSSSDDDSSYRRDRKREKKERKKNKRGKKKVKKEKKRASRDADDSSSQKSDPLHRNYELADALLNMLEGHPALVEDFPIMLIRLASGTTFDLSQMSDRDAAHCLAQVFTKLEPFGVAQDHAGAWCWVGGSRLSNPSHNEQIVLVKLVRAMLDQVGFTMQAIERHDNPEIPSTPEIEKVQSHNTTEEIAYMTAGTLRDFNPELAQELAGLCRMILDGESIALDGLEDNRLRNALENIFKECRLEKLEMENDEEEDNDSVAFGYGLPQAANEESKMRIRCVMQTCEETAKKPIVKGPLKPPSSYTNQVDVLYDDSESSDEEGPAMVGSTRQTKGLSKDLVAAQAALRSRQLANAKQGIDVSTAEAMEGQSREEWMVVPGKQFDFLSAVKAGKPMTSRKFGAQSKVDVAKQGESIHPSIQAEIQAIKEAHEESRGPSLMEQHRERKLQEQAAAAAAGKSESWKWNREKDLDSGRRVDKDALGMILGSAGNELKSKFHGGFG